MEKKEMGELVTVEPVELGLVGGNTTNELIKSAVAIATPLKQFIKDQGLYRFLGGDKPHVYAEGWAFMGTILGLGPQLVNTESFPVAGKPDEYGEQFRVTVAWVRISDQQMVCSAAGICGGITEPDWHQRPIYKKEGGKYVYQNGQKVILGYRPVPAHQRRSMAETRASSKALRLGFSWVMTIAGYNPTPMEEFTQDQVEEHEAPPPRPEGKDPLHRKPQATKPKQIKARFAGTCKICSGDFAEGDDIAFHKDSSGRAHVAHWDCFLDTELKKGE